MFKVFENKHNWGMRPSTQTHTQLIYQGSVSSFFNFVVVGAVEAVAVVRGGGGGGGAARVEPVQHHVHRRADELHVDDCGGK